VFESAVKLPVDKVYKWGKLTHLWITPIILLRIGSPGRQRTSIPEKSRQIHNLAEIEAIAT
jgi:hypothetical protein